MFNLFKIKKQEKIKINQINYDNINLMDCQNFIPSIKEGKVVKVYDGDTFTIASIIDNIVYKFNIRIRGVDCPELKGKNEEEKEMAKFVQKQLSEKILNKIVQCDDIAYDKYGRILANIKINNEDLSIWLLKNHYAVIYDGGKKYIPIEGWEKYINQ